jgi:hypothetical protein
MYYQSSKTAKAAVIGTIMPWTGGLSNIPDGWIACDGSTKNAKDYPLLVQVIGDIYNAGVSNLGGAFPNYFGEFVLPNLNGKILMDLEEQYFGDVSTGGTGKPQDTDADARSIISPFIGDNTDNGVPTLFNNVFTDVEFTLNDRTGYLGRISGNEVIPGEGQQSVYIGGRKLGTDHVRPHRHNGSYETLAGQLATRPGLGVVPYENIETLFSVRPDDEVTDVFPPEDEGLKIDFTYEIVQKNWGDFENTNGFGSGIPGRVVAGIRAENPPFNIKPRNVMDTPISPQLTDPRLDSEEVVNYFLGGNTAQIPTGFRNYYPDQPSAGNFGTLVSNTGSDWLGDDLEAHNHDTFDVDFDQGSLKPRSNLSATVNIPSTTLLDNAVNVGALQIDMNTSQPSLTCLYIIRAY